MLYFRNDGGNHMIRFLVILLLFSFPALAEEEIEGQQSIQSGTGIAVPVTPMDAPEQEVLPDEPLEQVPAEAVTVQFLVEHRSALNEKKITVHGVVISALLGEDACPPDRGMCAQPRVIIADTSGEERDTRYDLVILLPEGGNDAYAAGQTVDVTGVVSASPSAVVMRKE